MFYEIMQFLAAEQEEKNIGCLHYLILLISVLISMVGEEHYLFYSLAALIPSIAVGVRRMHAVGKSGWVLLTPSYNFVLAVTDSEQAENEYGPNPKA